MQFTWNAKKFYLDGKPVQIFSGEIHYTRVPREYWRHRFQMARAAGLNAICTYVFWNVHQSTDGGPFDFTGNNDLARFIKEAHEEGLLVLLRPGPYVCSEWDLGGLPAWLLAKPEIRLRSIDSQYLDAVAQYIRAVAGQIRDMQCTHGGPVIMLQVENEYGSYGSDKDYLRWLCGQWRRNGIDVPFFTSDGWSDWCLDRGTCEDPDVLATINLGSQIEQGFRALESWRERRGKPADAPDMIGEYWNGWFAHWGSEYPNDSLENRARRAREIEADLRWIRDTGRNVSLYMFHGGTNFGFWAGANHYLNQGYKCDVTSYDNTAPLNEHGAPTVKFQVLRSVLGEGRTLPPVPPVPPLIEIPPIEMDECAPLFENIDEPQVRCIESPQVKSMEMIGQNHGLILYRHQLLPSSGEKPLTIHDARDACKVYIDGKLVSTFDHTVLGGSIVDGMANREFKGRVVEVDGEICIETRISKDNPAVYPVPITELFEDHLGRNVDFTINTGNAKPSGDVPPPVFLPKIPDNGAILDILVENHGRVNYGMAMQDERKGITRKVVIDPAILMGWKIFPLPLDPGYMGSLKWCSIEHAPHDQPVFYRGAFTLEGIGDTFLDTREFTKGFVWVNGHNLGRFWSVGPQQTLYLPGPWLKEGKNSIVVLAMKGERGCIRGLKNPVWNDLRLSTLLT